MPALRADDRHEADLRLQLAQNPDLAHLRVRRRGDTLTLESGPDADAVKHARFRRVAVHLWVLEIATHTGRWQPSGMRGRLDELLKVLVETFGWVLTPIA